MSLTDFLRNSEEVGELRRKVEDLKKEKERLQKRFEAEKERRSKLSTEKQEAEKELKKLRQKLEDNKKEEKKEEGLKVSFKALSYEKASSILDKVSTVKSADRDLVSVYKKGRLSEIDDYRGLKNSLSSEKLTLVDRKTCLTAFIDEDFLQVVLKTRPFFESEWFISDSFKTEKIQKFISRKKTWVVVSAGESMIIKEKEGKVLDREEVKSRVDHSHTQGGYSQKRFERKREEQVDEHLEQLREKIDSEDPLVVGEKSLAKEIEGRYLGGFDSNKSLVNALYSFHLLESQD